MTKRSNKTQISRGNGDKSKTMTGKSALKKGEVFGGPQKEAIIRLISDYRTKIKNRADLEVIKRFLCKEYGLAQILNSEILKEYRALLTLNKLEPFKLFESLLRKRSIRTLSGIAPVAVLTKPYPCPGQCAYCPHEKDVPTSYLSNEPAVMRAIRCDYDPYQQVAARLRALESNGHEPTKIEIIVIGGTWSYLPLKYKYWYILNCFRAANDYEKIRKTGFERPIGGDKFKSEFKTPYAKNLKLEALKKALAAEQEKNERAVYKIIGLTLETRPDYINDAELREMRALGCTRVEIGVQVVDDAILKLNKRGHNVAAIADATRLLKQYGFKITYHLMPALPGATPARDFKLFEKLFIDERFQPDQIKFYPTVVTHGSLLYRWYRSGKYKPYSDKILQELIVKCKAVVPKYVRIIRLIRDIPGESIVAGNKITNLRQIMKQRGVKCNCIRCREVKDGIIGRHKLNIIEYPASGGREYFISADSSDGETLYGFCRLRLDENNPIAPAIIRELHVYGELVSVGGAKKVQHSGLGRKLMAEAEKIARGEFERRAREENKPMNKGGRMTNKNKLNKNTPKNSRLAGKVKLKIAVISGVGVRGYYRKLGYKLKSDYMIKELF